MFKPCQRQVCEQIIVVINSFQEQEKDFKINDQTIWWHDENQV